MKTKKWIVKKSGAPCGLILAKCFGSKRGFLAATDAPKFYEGAKQKLCAKRDVARTERLQKKLRGSMVDEQKDVARILAPGEMAVVPW